MIYEYMDLIFTFIIDFLFGNVIAPGTIVGSFISPENEYGNNKLRTILMVKI